MMISWPKRFMLAGLTGSNSAFGLLTQIKVSSRVRSFFSFHFFFHLKMHLTHLAGKRAWGLVLAPGKPLNSFLVPHSASRAVRHWRPSLHQHYTSSSSAPTTQRSKGKWIRRGLLTMAVAGVGTLAYILQQDKEYVDNSTHVAHQNIPPLALHPRSGGKKNLCVVSHQLDNTPLEETKPRLVIVGSGWGAVSVLKTLDKDKYNVTVISENNYFLFTPLLPSATVGTLELR
jgi:hypothetical protein